MQQKKCFSNIIFVLTLLSPIISFSLVCLIGEADIFGVAGIIRYSWIMWTFIPIGIVSLILGVKYIKGDPLYKKNLIIALVCLPLILLFGAYRFIFTNVSVSYDVEHIYAVEEKGKLDLPNQIKVATNSFDSYNLSYVKLVDEEEIISFEYKISANKHWEKELIADIEVLLPLDVQYEIWAFDYYLYYNLSTDKYNECPPDGEWECIFVAYDRETQRLVVLDGLLDGLIMSNSN